MGLLSTPAKASLKYFKAMLREFLQTVSMPGARVPLELCSVDHLAFQGLCSLCLSKMERNLTVRGS